MDVWNQTIEKNDRQIEPRARLYASELGGSLVDNWLKLKGEKYTNPPNSRSMRKFMAGDIWEWIIKQVLIRSGIPFTQQDRVYREYPGMLPISGKIDFIVGGQIDYVKALENLEQDDIPDFLKKPAKAIIELFMAKYPAGLDLRIIEVKSVGSFVFEDLLAKDNPKTHHMIQACVYHLEKQLPTDLLYVCRDDCRLLQYNIDTIAPALEEEIKKYVSKITDYYKNDEQPPIESLMLWDKDLEKFKTNWKVQYSPYLTKLYSYDDEGKERFFETPDEYYDLYQPKVSSWNRVVSRIKTGKPITKSNQEYIDIMQKEGYDILKMVTIKVEPTIESIKEELK